MTPNTQGTSWREELKELSYQLSCDRSGDGISATYRFGKVPFVERMTSFIEEIASKERVEGERRGAEKERERLLGENSHLKRVSRAWDGVEADGQPNELVKAQIFGFRQAESILNEATLPADSTEGN